MKLIVTQEELDANPSLVEEGVKVGDEIEIPDTNKVDLAGNPIDNPDNTEGGPGGQQPGGPQPGKPETEEPVDEP